MRIGLVSRTDRKMAIEVAKKIAEQFSHYDLFIDPDLLPYVDGDPIKDVDVLLVVGGDGTILRTVHKYSFPIVAVKMGQRGHLCEVTPKQISSIDGILKEHTVEKRMKIEVAGHGEALNEVVVRADIPDKVATFRVEYAGIKHSIVGDGIIVATPTGSTAYSLAAGGPVIEEGCPVFCITPICPLNSAFFPIVVSSEWEVFVTAKDKPCHIALDGCNLSRLKAGDSIEVRKSRHYVEFWRKK